MTLDHLSQSPISSLPFPGFENVRLTHRQLVAAVRNDTWKTALGNVQAVYLQTDRRTGWHYVGSAYSHKGAEQGLLSRWSEYAYGDILVATSVSRSWVPNISWTTSNTRF